MDISIAHVTGAIACAILAVFFAYKAKESKLYLVYTICMLFATALYLRSGVITPLYWNHIDQLLSSVSKEDQSSIYEEMTSISPIFVDKNRIQKFYTWKYLEQ